MEGEKSLKSRYSIRLLYLGWFGCVFLGLGVFGVGLLGFFLVASSWLLEHSLSTRYFK